MAKRKAVEDAKDKWAPWKTEEEYHQNDMGEYADEQLKRWENEGGSS